MQIKFTTSLLEGLYNLDKKAILKAGLKPEIVKSYYHTVNFLKSINKPLDIRSVRGYNLEKYEGHRSMRLNGKRRLEIDFEGGYIQVVDILRISNHYGNKIR